MITRAAGTGLPDFLATLPMLPQVDLAHSLQVTRLALELLDALAAPLAFDTGDRDILAAAAFWHDTGQAIAERKHHRHSYALIMALDLPRMDPQVQRQIACIARYHRKALPHQGHPEYAQLPGEAQRRVQRLASLLRIADGLDYSHRSLVRGVWGTIRRGDALIVAEATAEATAEIHRAGEKADLFAQTFRLSPRIERGG